MSPALVQPYYQAAHDYVERALGVSLDGSEESLAFVDHYIDTKAPKGAALDSAVLALTAAALGAYFGEVVLRRFGGRWITDSDDPSGWRIELDPAPLYFYPVGLAAAALLKAEAPGYDASIGTRTDLEAPLEDALAAAAPVEESYFYSLTGRFETIEHMLDLLVEIQRQRKAEQS
jgi:hypothetical protein